MTDMEDMWMLVKGEAMRAHLKYLGKGESLFSPDLECGEKLAVLVEEVGEVAKACLAGVEPENDTQLDKELIQVAAMAFSWLCSIYGVKP